MNRYLAALIFCAFALIMTSCAARGSADDLSAPSSAYGAVSSVSETATEDNAETEVSKTESDNGVTELSEEPAYSCPEEESEIEYYDPSLQSSADGEVIFEEPPESGTYSFAAPEFLYAALKGFDEMGSLRNDPDFERFGDWYISFLDEFTKEIPADLMYPYLNGSPMKISGVAEWQQITLFTCELYNLPWIWYYCEYDGKCVVVGVSYLDYLKQFGVAQTEDVIEFISSVAPHSPLPANREQYVNSSGLTDINETELVLADGVRLKALVLEYANGRTYYRFIQNRCILSVWYYDGGKPDDGFWNAFDIMPLEWKHKRAFGE